MNKKFEYEREIAKRFLDNMRISYGNLADPLEAFQRETGADVQAHLNSGQKIGIQVTVFHVDEALARNTGAPCLRSQEEKDKELGEIQTYSVPTDYRAALCKRIGDKIFRAQRYGFSEFDEIWLLVSASLPQVGAMASTTMLPFFIDAEELNNEHHEALSLSKYSAAFLYMINENKIYQWRPLTKWQLTIVGNIKPTLASEEDFIKKCVNNTELRIDPHGWAQREALKVLDELHHKN